MPRIPHKVSRFLNFVTRGRLGSAEKKEMNSPKTDTTGEEKSSRIFGGEAKRLRKRKKEPPLEPQMT